jgi:hypothetical protein
MEIKNNEDLVVDAMPIARRRKSPARLVTSRRVELVDDTAAVVPARSKGSAIRARIAFGSGI